MNRNGKTIRLTESQLHEVVMKSVMRILHESEEHTQKNRISVNPKIIKDFEIKEVSNGYYVSGVIKGVKCGQHLNHKPTRQEAVDALFANYSH